MLVFIVFVTFCLVAFFACLIEIASYFSSKKDNINPQFSQFQNNYFLIYFLLAFGDWLNAPYLYKLYSAYGFLEEQIAIIYVCGYASSMIVGTFTNYICKKYGCWEVFLSSVIVYAVTCLIKLSSDYSTLIIGRILSGIATAFVFSSQEIWYNSMHVDIHDFPIEWVKCTLEKSSKGNCFLAVLAGIVAYLMTEVYGLGPVAPSVLSVVVLLISGALAALKWKTPHPTSSIKPLLEPNNAAPVLEKTEKSFWKDCSKGLRTIVLSNEILALGLMQSLYESVLCLFVFLWTPVLDHHNPPLGIVFASLMAGSMVAGSLYPLVRSYMKSISPALYLLAIFISATATVLFCVFSTEPTREFPIVSFFAFFIFEAISGLYFAAMRDAKHALGFNKSHFVVTSWFRIPLNLFACLGLILLHTSSNLTGTRNLFACCAIAIALAAIISGNFLFQQKQSKCNLNNDST